MVKAGITLINLLELLKIFFGLIFSHFFSFDSFFQSFLSFVISQDTIQIFVGSFEDLVCLLRGFKPHFLFLNEHLIDVIDDFFSHCLNFFVETFGGANEEARVINLTFDNIFCCFSPVVFLGELHGYVVNGNVIRDM